MLAKFGFGAAENKPCKIFPLSSYRSPRCVRTLEGIARPKPPATELETRLCQRAATNELAALRLDAVKRLNGLASFDALTPSQKKATIHLVAESGRGPSAAAG